MRNFHRSISLFLCLALALCLLPAEAGAAGLSAFTDSKTYAAGQFTDVAQSAWYAPSVAAVCRRGVMEGAGSRFLPNDHLTWAQAAAIAARLHAIYHDTAVEKSASGAWYEPYLRYARQNQLLPAGCPEGAAVNTAQITREQIAGLFAGVLAAGDLPAVNDSPIPDLGEVSPEYADAVQAMYRAGVMTGKDGGRFDPDGLATRAEIAAIVTRLLCPAQRVCRDSRMDAAMEGQWSNLSDGGGACVTVGDTTYFLYDTRLDSEDHTGCILARSRSGAVKEIYQTNDLLTNMFAGDDGYLYFTLRKGGRIVRLKPGQTEPETVYASKNGIGPSTLYGGSLYVLDRSGTWTGSIVKVTDGKTETVANGLPLSGHTKQLHIFNGVIYYWGRGEKEFEEWIYALSISGGKPEVILKPQYCDGSAFVGGALYYTRAYWQKERHIYRTLLALPEQTELFATMPVESTALYACMYAYRGEIYMLSSGAWGIWKADKNGTVTKFCTMPNGNVEHVSFFPGGAIMLWIDQMNNMLSEDLSVIFPGGATMPYSLYVKRPCEIRDLSGLGPKGETREFKNTAAPGTYCVYGKEAYLTADGALILKLEFSNQTAGTVCPGSLSIDLRASGARRNLFFQAIGSWELPGGATASRYYYIPAEFSDRPWDLSTLQWKMDFWYQ